MVTLTLSDIQIIPLNYLALTPSVSVDCGVLPVARATEKGEFDK